MKHLSYLVLLAFMLSSCVPKTQYTALEAERNYYRNQSALADSLADQRAISSYDEVDVTDNELRARIQEVESLRATNIALNKSYQDIQVRYKELLDQSQSMLVENGEQVTGLQQSLADRTAEVAQREAELRQLELDLKSREEAIARVEGTAAPTGYGQVTAPGGRPDISAGQNAALVLNNIQNDLTQLLNNNLAASNYDLVPTGLNRLQLTLTEKALYKDGFSVSNTGQQLLRRITQVMRNYPSAEIVVVGHADSANPNALRAYEDSTDKSIHIAQQLINFGIDPGMIIAGGKGFYDPVENSATEEGREANRRTDLHIIIPQ